MRCVGRSEGQVHEEWSVRSHRLRVIHETNGLVNQVFADVVAVLWSSGRIDVMVVGCQFGVELVCFTLQEAVEPIKAPLQGPVVERSRCRRLRHWGQVPLADTCGGVTVVL